MQKAVFRRCACIQLGFFYCQLPTACCLLVAHFGSFASKSPFQPAKDLRVNTKDLDRLDELLLRIAPLYDGMLITGNSIVLNCFSVCSCG
jgi:hypothetical protein